ncbi:MAG: hypothetical protein M3P49_09845 [Actinomycetota bacterium]|nr:hypothetical protein [Actinomycetota bacterium]
MTQQPLSPDLGSRGALVRMLGDPVWGSAYERECYSGLRAVEGKAAVFASALAAREPGLDASVDAVRAMLVSLALEMHPDSPASTEALAARTRPERSPAALDEPWDPAWASELMARAIREMAEALPEDADPPALDDETAEVYAAAAAEDRERYSRAVAAWAEAARTVPSAPEDGTPTDPTWNEDWAQDEIARALVYVDARVASGDAPAADDEWREVHAATEAREEARLRAAVKAAVKASLRTLRREGRLLLEPQSPTPNPERGGSPRSSSAA